MQPAMLALHLFGGPQVMEFDTVDLHVGPDLREPLMPRHQFDDSRLFVAQQPRQILKG